MDTPIANFVRRYAEGGTVRAHMPGHKGRGPLGCEALDITEICGADSLYEAEGVIARSEANAAVLFGTATTFYSTEGSSQCIRAMLHLALLRAPHRPGTRPVIVAARNAHKAFVQAAALLDFDVVWLWPEEETFTLCRCPVSAGGLGRTLRSLPEPPAAVYVTSPDYLGGALDLAALAETAHAFGVPLLTDNAHGSYLRFLGIPSHPMDLGADLCCDSAHKTLPVLTGGAYLHVGRSAPAEFADGARLALSLFGSTSPSYLTLQSLDLANAALAGEYPGRLARCAAEVEALRMELRSARWEIADSDPLKLTVAAGDSGHFGRSLAETLRQGGVECEYADPDFLVLMFTPENPASDFHRVAQALGTNAAPAPLPRPALHLTVPETACTIREAVLSPREILPVEQCLGRVLAAPAVSCPPAVPVLVGGEIFREDALALFRRYGVRTAAVLRDPA